MIHYIEGDIFNSPAQVIVNTVNTVGVMGKGLALAFKQRYPKMFVSYRNACEKKQLTVGKLMLFQAPDYWVLLFPTKENWRNPSKLEYIEKGLMKFVNTYAEKNITSIAFPKLGCGNGELNWDEVRPLMEKYLKPLPIDVYIYIGPGQSYLPEHKKTDETMDWLKMNSRDMSFDGIKDDILSKTQILPYEFVLSDEKYSLKWENGLKFMNRDNESSLFISEDEFFKIWDYIRSKGVFSISSNQKVMLLTFALIESLGYISKVRISRDKNEEMTDGYQFNEGAGRMYSMKGSL
ncbi:macro domain-containing protein [Proteocatella sphenisci]|uniref:macro domain-containing protein n=1 Tax=Proteocatella sphenisci TaxID=181070 RepID=UPI0004BC869A|nr:macro domain-containing protein [Proteocatella sphenisci]